jgi:hypothetical protein
MVVAAATAVPSPVFDETASPFVAEPKVFNIFIAAFFVDIRFLV